MVRVVFRVVAVNIEMYYSPYCQACSSCGPVDPQAPVRWINAITHLEDAVRLRITRLPALVIDGRRVAQGARALAKLQEWLAAAGSPI